MKQSDEFALQLSELLYTANIKEISFHSSKNGPFDWSCDTTELFIKFNDNSYLYLDESELESMFQND